MLHTSNNNLVSLSSKVGSCGHFLQDHDGPGGQGHQVVIRLESEAGKRSVSYRNVCTACRIEYITQGLLLSTCHEQTRWLSPRPTSIAT